MERGYVKLWRKVRDSRSHSRGVLHRALIETFLVEANWKKGYFCGQEIGPGQLAVSVLGLAKELKVSRTTLQRAIKDLVADEFITVTNMGNRWTMITLVNWDTYQNNENQNGQPMGNRRATDGQPAGIIKEYKKERIKEKNPPLPPLGEREGGEALAGPGMEFVELRDAYNQVRAEGPLDGYPEYKALKHSRTYPGNDKLICDFLKRKESGVWNLGYEIGLARYLKTRLWEAPIVPRPTRLTAQEERDRRELEKFLNDEPSYAEQGDGKDPF